MRVAICAPPGFAFVAGDAHHRDEMLRLIAGCLAVLMLALLKKTSIAALGHWSCY